MRWYYKHKLESVWKRAAGVYVRILSQPQLYIEGNHRTGALIMSYIQVRDGKAPFVLTVDNAKAYFVLLTLIKETRKTATTVLMKLPRMKKHFANFSDIRPTRRMCTVMSQGQMTGCLAQGMQILDETYPAPP